MLLCHNASGHRPERQRSIGRLQGLLVGSAPGELTAVDNVDARGAPTQLITLAFPLPGDPRAMNGCAGEHSARRRIARNEQVKGSSPFPAPSALTSCFAPLVHACLGRV